MAGPGISGDRSQTQAAAILAETATPADRATGRAFGARPATAPARAPRQSDESTPPAIAETMSSEAIADRDATDRPTPATITQIHGADASQRRIRRSRGDAQLKDGFRFIMGSANAQHSIGGRHAYHRRMSVRLVGSLLLCLAVPVTAHAENHCGSMVRTMSRFRGTVRSVQPTRELPAGVQEVDLDAFFVVTVHVDRVDDPGAAPRAGELLAFGIHSPSRTFGPRKLTGKTFELEAERMDCDGKFRRYLTLRRRFNTPIVATYDGQLEVGDTYRATVKVTDDSLRLLQRLSLPMHHGGSVSWMNRDAFPQLNKDGAKRDITFEVISLHITNVREGQWLSAYDLKIVGVQ